MKSLFVSAIALAAMTACSHGPMHKIDTMSFEDGKAHLTQMLENKQTAVTSTQNCVKEANTKADLEVCMKNMHEMKKH
jgi:hypothetical protein